MLRAVCIKSMKLIEAKEEHLELLTQLNSALIQDEGHRNSMDVDQLKKRMSGWLGSEYKAALFYDESVLGYALWREESEYIYLRQFFVVAEYRRRNIGSKAFALLQKCYWPKSRIRLDVLVNNQRARKFWNSVGFNDYCITLEKNA